MLTALQMLPRDAELLAFEAGCEDYAVSRGGPSRPPGRVRRFLYEGRGDGMSGDSSVGWATCSEDECRGIRLDTGGRCLAHAASQDLDVELKRLSQEGTIDARGVTISAELLIRILGAAPPDEERPNRPRFIRASFDKADFGDWASFGGATLGDSASFRGATFGDNTSSVARPLASTPGSMA